MMNGNHQKAAGMRGRWPLNRWRCLWLLITALVFVAPARAQNQVLVIGDVSRSYVRSYTSALNGTLKQNGLSTVVVDTKDSREFLVDAQKYRCVVTVGHDAAREVENADITRPVLHALVTEQFARELYKKITPSSERTYLLVEQPIERLLLLARIALPLRKRIGVLYGPSSISLREEVRRNARRLDINLIEKEINSDAQLDSVIVYFKQHADLVITLPDPVVVNGGSVKSLILGAYLRNLPLEGYSQALVKAGALMSVHSTPEQLGQQSAEMIANSYWTDTAMNGTRIHPRYFQVSVNYQVARALGIDLPEEGTLVSSIRKAEMTQ